MRGTGNLPNDSCRARQPHYVSVEHTLGSVVLPPMQSQGDAEAGGRRRGRPQRRVEDLTTRDLFPEDQFSTSAQPGGPTLESTSVILLGAGSPSKGQTVDNNSVAEEDIVEATQ